MRGALAEIFTVLRYLSREIPLFIDKVSPYKEGAPAIFEVQRTKERAKKRDEYTLRCENHILLMIMTYLQKTGDGKTFLRKNGATQDIRSILKNAAC